MSGFGQLCRKGLAFLLLLLCAVRNGGTSVLPGNYTRTFIDTMLIIPSGSSLRTAIDFTLSFTVTRDILPTEYIGARLPRFTQRFQSINESVNVGNVTISDVIVSPSYFYTAAWYETPNIYGSAAQGILPFRDSTLIIKSAINATIESGSTVLLKVHRENGIGAWCGFASSTISTTEVVTPSDPFEIFTLFNYVENNTFYGDGSPGRNFTLEKNTSSPIDTISGLGPGCDCHGHGKCDFCYEVCQCFEGYGASSDVVSTGASLSVFCDDRVCPAGNAIADIPSTSNEAHNIAECSNHGICDRSTGECQCFEPFTGASCDKLRCPNDCSGHGFCKDMYDLSVDQKMERVRRVDFTYGSAAAMKTSAWDFRTMRACVCESSWPVGFNSGERQLPEYFGPDCSLRHCPSGDDPYTSTDEEDCQSLTQYPGEIYMVGMPGNKCHVDCANRGICDYRTGKCNCFEGSWGPACQYISNAGSSRAGFVSASNGTYISNVHGN